MTTPSQPHDNALLDAYLDGQLQEAELSAFERQLERHEGLRIQVERQMALDDTLLRLFPTPSTDQLLPHWPSTHARQRRSLSTTDWSHRARLMATAACLALIVLAGWRVWQFAIPPEPGRYRRQPWRSLATVYDDTLKGGFKPNWVCKDDEEFMMTFRSRLGQRLLLAQSEGAVLSVGIGYCHSITPQTLYLLARVSCDVDAEPTDEVLVFVDRVERDMGPSLPEGSALRLFRRQVGKLLLFELTPCSQPRVLDLFYQP